MKKNDGTVHYLGLPQLAGIPMVPFRLYGTSRIFLISMQEPQLSRCRVLHIIIVGAVVVVLVARLFGVANHREQIEYGREFCCGGF